jgi:hypothetical protein
MPSFDPKGGFSGPLSTYQQPGWAPRFRDQEREEAERQEAEQQKFFATEARREAERFRVRRPEPPPPFQPRVPSGTIDQGRLITLIESINAGGLHLNRTALIEHGQAKFKELLQLGRDCRLFGINLNVELTDFRALSAWMTNLFPSPIQPLGLGEQLRGEKLHRAAQIKGLDDVWRCPPDPLLHKIYAHWQAFKPLVFGQSLLDAADTQDVVRSPLWSEALTNASQGALKFASSKNLLADWQEFIIPPSGETFILIQLGDLLLAVIAWLADDAVLATAIGHPDFWPVLARDLSGLRVPGEREVRRAHRLVEAFALGLDAATDTAKPALATWAYLNGLERDLTKVRHLLAPIVRRFPLTARWHGEAVAASMIPQPSRYDGAAYEFDEWGFRASLDAAIYGTLRQARAIAALAIADELAGESSRLAAVTGDRLVVTSPSKGVVKTQLVAKLEEAVKGELTAAFGSLAARIAVSIEDHL